MKKILIITGANRGLGKAIIDLALQEEDTVVISLSRSLCEQHLKVPGNRMVFVQSDLLKPFSAEALNIVDKYIKEDSVLYFLNNAGTILPIDRIGNLEEEAISNSIRVNIEYPSNLINFILGKYLDNELVIVNITSGAGNNPIAHWSLYGSSKAFMKMFFKVLAEENINNKNVLIYSIDPGTMDTEMQTSIRNNNFPKRDYFQTLKENETLIRPEDAAVKILSHIKFML